MSMTAIGKRMNRDLRKITGAVVITLQRLTEHYGEVDGTRPADDTGLRSVEFR